MQVTFNTTIIAVSIIILIISVNAAKAFPTSLTYTDTREFIQGINIELA